INLSIFKKKKIFIKKFCKKVIFNNFFWNWYNKKFFFYFKKKTFFFFLSKDFKYKKNYIINKNICNSCFINKFHNLEEIKFYA
ncbi:hypothetical protein K5B08_00910, partial [Candidatus Carsonella ruddii]|nr:hypothetical protein [Candidatus Carsonella ruddii]